MAEWFHAKHIQLLSSPSLLHGWRRGGKQIAHAGAQQTDKQAEWLGELWTIQFPAHAELPGTSGKVVPGEHTAPCPACDNLCFKALASNTLFAWEHMGTANSDGLLLPAERQRLCTRLCTLQVLPLHTRSSLFLPSSLQPWLKAWTPLHTNRAQPRGSTENLAKYAI